MIWSGKCAAIRTFEKQLAGVDLEVVETSADVVLLDHGHTNLHILFVLEGALEEDTRVFAAGDVRVSPAGDRHFARLLERSRCLLFHLHAPSELEETRHRWSIQLNEVLPEAIALANEITGNPSVEEERAQEFAGQLQTRLLAETIESRADKAPSWLGELHTSIQSMEAI